MAPRSRLDSRTARLTLMVLVAAAAVWFRLDGLGRESVYHDEAHSALMARLAPSLIVREAATADNNPPLYYLILHGFVRLAGSESETSLRLPSAILGILGVGATFLVAVALGGAVVGLWAAALVALSVFHIQFSRDARMYSLLFAAATISLYAFLRLRAGGRRSAVLWIGSALATIFAHTVGVFVILAQHLCWAALRTLAPGFEPPLRKWLALNAAVAMLAAPWGWVVFHQHRRMDGVFWVSAPYLTQPLDVLVQLAGSLALLGLLLALGAIGIVAVIRGRAAMAAPIPPLAVPLVLGIWGAVPLLTPWIASYVSVPIFTPRITIASLAPLCIAAAFGLAALRPPAAIVAGGVALAMSGQLAWEYTHRLTKEDWRAVAAYIEPQLTPDDLVLFHEGSRRKGFEYYVPRPVGRVAGFPGHRFTSGQTLEPSEMPELHHLVGNPRRVWLVLASSNDPEHLIEQALSARFAMSDRREYRRLSVVKFDAR